MHHLIFSSLSFVYTHTPMHIHILIIHYTCSPSPYFYLFFLIHSRLFLFSTYTHVLAVSMYINQIQANRNYTFCALIFSVHCPDSFVLNSVFFFILITTHLYNSIVVSYNQCSIERSIDL